MSLALKRKADDLDDSDDEEPMLGRQVLPVANLPDNFDGVPMDGLQYLFTVRRDARSLPHITRVANPYEMPEAMHPDPPASFDIVASQKDVLPSEEWRETFLRRFKNFRKNSVQPTIHIHIPDSSVKIMPDKKERDLWWAFLAGRPESEWNPPKKPKQPKLSRWQQHHQKKAVREFGDEMRDMSLPYDAGEFALNGLQEFEIPIPTVAHTGTSADVGAPHNDSAIVHNISTIENTPELKDASTETGISYSPREPTPALLHHIDHRYAIHLLMYFGHWLNVRLEEGDLPHTDITLTHMRWIFTLLSRVDDWISGDEMSLLRNLARSCMELMAERRRASAPVSPGAIAADSDGSGSAHEEGALADERACWMIITAITGVWGQRDLWTDAESILSKVT